MTSKSKALTTPAASSFALQLTSTDDSDYLAPGEKLSINDLPRIKVPAGGGLIWTLPNGEPAKKLHAAIVAFHVNRAFWNDEFSGENNPPDCSSHDGVNGVGLWGKDTAEDGTVTFAGGNPSGTCATCPMAVFGSGKGNAQACRQITSLLLVLEGEPTPVRLNVPAGSYQAFYRYRTQVLRPFGIPHYTVATDISLVAAKSSTKIDYAQMHFEMAEALDVGFVAQLMDFRKVFAAQAASAPVEV